MYIINDTEQLAFVDTRFRPLPEKSSPADYKGTLPFFIKLYSHNWKEEP